MVLEHPPGCTPRDGAAGNGCNVFVRLYHLALTHSPVADAIWKQLGWLERRVVRASCRGGRDAARACTIPRLMVRGRVMQEQCLSPSEAFTGDFGVMFPNVTSIQLDLPDDTMLPDVLHTLFSRERDSGQPLRYPSSTAALLSAFARSSPTLLKRLQSLTLNIGQSEYVLGKFHHDMQCALVETLGQCRQLRTFQLYNYHPLEEEDEDNERAVRMTFAAPPNGRFEKLHEMFSAVAFGGMFVNPKVAEYLERLVICGRQSFPIRFNDKKLREVGRLQEVVFEGVDDVKALSRSMDVFLSIVPSMGITLAYERTQVAPILSGSYIGVRKLKVMDMFWGSCRELVEACSLEELRLLSLGGCHSDTDLMKLHGKNLWFGSLKKLYLQPCWVSETTPHATFLENCRVLLKAMSCEKLESLELGCTSDEFHVHPALPADGVLDFLLRHPQVIGTYRPPNIHFGVKLFATGAQLAEVAAKLPMLMNQPLHLVQCSEDDVAHAVCIAGTALHHLHVRNSVYQEEQQEEQGGDEGEGGGNAQPLEVSDLLFERLAASCPNLVSLKLDVTITFSNEAIDAMSTLSRLTELVIYEDEEKDAGLLARLAELRNPN